jgi:hypothetical protein
MSFSPPYWCQQKIHAGCFFLLAFVAPAEFDDGRFAFAFQIFGAINHETIAVSQLLPGGPYVVAGVIVRSGPRR